MIFDMRNIYSSSKIKDQGLKYFSVGKKQLNYFKDYTSHNTTRLNVKEIKKMLLNLGILKKGFND